MTYTLHLGNCLDVLRTLPDNSVDAVVTDPPYGFSFMGKKWDYDVPSVEIWRECLRVLKPGGHLLAFAGTRTQHRMAVRIEDAGFEIRDMIAWVYSTGFPKSLDVSKAIDRAAGAEREVVGNRTIAVDQWTAAGRAKTEGGQSNSYAIPITIPATPAAAQWSGWGTAIKPSLEPVTVARKPLSGTVAANVLQWGTGALNVDGCRVHADDAQAGRKRHGGGIPENHTSFVLPDSDHESPSGRWPANLIHDGGDEVLAGFPQSSAKNGVTQGEGKGGIWSKSTGKRAGPPHGDSGSAARFFYCAKASKSDRDHGCDALPERTAAECVDREADTAGMDSPRAGAGRTSGSRNHHPTVKPTDLMRYLCRLVTPPGGTVLDPFVGSGSTGRGAVLEGFDFVGIDMDPDYLAIAEARIAAAVQLRAEELAEAAREAAKPQQLSLF